MLFHVEHSLFYKQGQTLWQARLSLSLTLCILILNVGANNTTLSLISFGIGLVLLIHAQMSGQHRLNSTLIRTSSVILILLLGGAALSGDLVLFSKLIARMLCGLIWVLWLGTQIDWSILRRILLSVRVPKEIISTLDHAVMQGVITQREWINRRNAIRLRAGKFKLSLSSWANLLAEGALQSFLRLERIEENSQIRSSSIIDTSDQETIHLESVDVRRGQRLVLEQITLHITVKEWVILCGPSGVGKSSLLRLLAGLDGPNNGIMTRLGSSISPDTAPSHRLDGRIALLVQNPEHHFVASTVGEDISWGLIRRGLDVTEARKKSFEMARSLGIDHLWTQPCHMLSFGEQRRIALAGILVLEPKLLLLDEPTAGLDPVAAHNLRLVIHQIIRKIGAACVWATHDLNSWPQQAKRIVLLKDKHILFDGTVAEGLSRPWLLRAGLAVPHEREERC